MTHWNPLQLREEVANDSGMVCLHHVQRISPTGPINGRVGSAGISETETTKGKWQRNGLACSGFDKQPQQCTSCCTDKPTKICHVHWRTPHSTRVEPHGRRRSTTHQKMSKRTEGLSMKECSVQQHLMLNLGLFQLCSHVRARFRGIPNVRCPAIDPNVGRPEIFVLQNNMDSTFPPW